MIRRWLLILTLPLLVLGVCLLRSHRFERIENEVTVGMAELRSALPEPADGAAWEQGKDGTILRLTANSSAKQHAISFRLPVSTPVEALHIALDIRSINLIRGEREWQDGRVLIRWLPEHDNGTFDVDPVASARGNEHKPGISLVTKPSFDSGYPLLVIENLAASGELLISGMELTPVRHRAAWRWMRWVLAAGWLAWIVASLSGFPRVALPRRCAAAFLWLTMGAHFAFPGPWERLTPMIIPYNLGEELGRQQAVPYGESPMPDKKMPQGLVSHGAHGKIPHQGGWILQIRHKLRNQRLLLHTGFVIGITVLFSFFVGARRAAWLAAGMVVAIEGSQTGFGYGFGSDDFVDLVCGAIGIALGLLVFGKLCRWRAFSRWMALPPAELAPPSVPHGLPDERESPGAVKP